ncbi:prepilin-type cleavage/methylation domain-containing protein [Erwinia sp. CPCC 100877]|nr:prepilin-type cleavage/methylation domain-containing protein [Erwinia sp. CPCC 100877]
MVKKQCCLKKNKYLAFTLLECLLALCLLSVICLLFSALVKNTTLVASRLKNTKEKEWQVFLIQLENELQSCQYEKTQPNKIIFRNDKKNTSVWIESKLGKIVKVENGGYQPLLTEVKQARFAQKDNAVLINVQFKDATSYSAKWIIPKVLQYEA